MVVIDIRGASVMFVIRMCISTLWSFQNQYPFMLEATYLRLIGFEYFQEKKVMLKEIKYEKQI